MAAQVTDIPARQVLDLAPMGVLLLRAGRVEMINRRLALWLGRPAADFAGLDAARAAPWGLAVLFEDYRELRLSLPEGELRLWRERVALADAWEAHFFEDLSREARLRRERNEFETLARSLETRDPETGFLHRAAVLETLERQVDRSRRYGNRLAVIHLSLEPAAAGVPSCPLGAFARELSAELRWSDRVGRLAGTAFLLILPETSMAGAEALVAKLGRDRAPLAGLPGWRMQTAIGEFQPGDDARGLLRRVGVAPP